MYANECLMIIHEYIVWDENIGASMISDVYLFRNLEYSDVFADYNLPLIAVIIIIIIIMT